MDTRYIAPGQIEEVIDEARRALNYHAPVTWGWNSRFTAALGRARFKRGDFLNDRVAHMELSGPLWGRASNEERRTTIIHEFCHIVDFDVNPRIASNRRQIHGRSWKLLMLRCGVKPERCHAVDRTGISRKNRGTEDVVCSCPGRVHTMGKIRLRKMDNGMVYRCRICKQPVRRKEMRAAA